MSSFHDAAVASASDAAPCGFNECFSARPVPNVKQARLFSKDV